MLGGLYLTTYVARAACAAHLEQTFKFINIVTFSQWNFFNGGDFIFVEHDLETKQLQNFDLPTNETSHKKVSKVIQMNILRWKRKARNH